MKPNPEEIKYWYDKLKEDGFEDVESFDSDMNPLNYLSNSSCTNLDLDVQSESVWDSEKFQYYYTLADCVRDAKTLEHKIILKRVSDGESQRSVARSIGCSNTKVHRIIKKYLKNRR